MSAIASVGEGQLAQNSVEPMTHNILAVAGGVNKINHAAPPLGSVGHEASSREVDNCQYSNVGFAQTGEWCCRFATAESIRVSRDRTAKVVATFAAPA
jgi:hypothetical protein